MATKPLADELRNEHKSFDAAGSRIMGAKISVKRMRQVNRPGETGRALVFL